MLKSLWKRVKSYFITYYYFFWLFHYVTHDLYKIDEDENLVEFINFNILKSKIVEST